MTAQDHYDKIRGELPGDTEVDMIGRRFIDVDLGNDLLINNFELVGEVVDTIQKLGYTVEKEPYMYAGYRGAMNEALMLHIPIEPLEDY